MGVFVFRDFRFDTLERRLTRGGELVELTPKAMDILEVFVARPGELITRDEIIGKVWNGALVEEGNLSVHISKLRKALGESRETRYVETVAGSGYRFTASIGRSSSNGHNPAITPDPIHASNGNGFHTSRDSEAARLHLTGKHHFDKHAVDRVLKSIDCFEKSIRIDPSNIPAYVDLIAGHRLLFVQDQISITELATRVEPLITILSEIGAALDNVQHTIGEIRMYCDWKFDEALNRFKRALAINPNYLASHHRMAELAVYSGRFGEPLVHISVLLRLDPASLLTGLSVARLYYLMGRYDLALASADEMLELEPNNFEVLLVRGAILAELNKLDSARECFAQSREDNLNVECLSMLGYVHALLGDSKAARRYIEEVKSYESRNSINSNLARIYLAMGAQDQGLMLLEKALKQRECDLIAAGVDPRWKAVRHHPRFVAILHAVGIFKKTTEQFPISKTASP